jgi:tetratricopeptide (TPR) repeat protein
MAARTRRARGAAPASVRTSPEAPAAAYPRWIIPAGLALLCVAAYSNAFGTGFALDNRQLILRDPRVRALTGENLSLIFNHTYWWPYGESGLYRPLTTLTYLFNFAILGNGEAPAGYHLFNLLFHIANVLLLWRLTWRITANTWIAGVTAALWAVLPLSTEAVTNIVGRADLMAATASLAAVLLYLRVRDEVPRASSGVRYLLLAALAVTIVAGALAKESAVAVLGVLVAAELIWWNPVRSRRVLTAAAAVCVLPLAWWAWQRASIIGAGGAAEFPYTDNPMVGAPAWQRLLTAVQVIVRYVALLLWPAHLSNDYSFAQIPLAQGTAAEWFGVALLAAGAAAALWQTRRDRRFLFFAAFAFITFLPASNLLFATGTIMGERLLYLPSAGLVAIAAIGLERLASMDRMRAAATGLVAVLVLACGVRTLARNPVWTDDVTLWRSAVRSAPASAKAHRALAEALYDADPTHQNLDAVIAEADRSVALLDTLPDELNTFQAFRQAGAYYLDKADALSVRNDHDPESGRLYARALNLLDRALAIARAGASRIAGASSEPDADAERLRAAAMLGMKNPSSALTAANRARALQPANPLAYHLAAASLLGTDRADEAAMLLLTGGIVSGDGSLGREAMSLYSDGLDPDGCAVVGTGPSAALNPKCAIVARHSCNASAAAYQIFNKSGQSQRAEQIKAAAVSNLGCAADLMDRPNTLVP